MKVVPRLVMAGFLFTIPFGAYFAQKGGAELYVAASGDDGNPGTSEKPVRTMQHAADMAKPGTTVHVRGGIYCEQLTVKVSGNAQQGFITIESHAGEQAILDGGCLTLTEGNNSMILLESVSYVRVQGLEIRNNRTDNSKIVPAGIRVFGSGSHIEILKNNVHHIEQNSTFRVKSGQGANGFGIAVYGTDAKSSISDLVIEDNEVHHLKTGSSESLVVNGNVAGFRISKNRVHDNNNIGIDVIGFERTAPVPEVDRARDGVVSENLVYNITSRGNSAYGNDANSDGIYVDGGTRILIERNVMHDVDYGLELASEHLTGNTSHILARNNLIYSCHTAAIAIGGYDAKRGKTEDTIIVNNTLYKNDTWDTGTGEILMQFYLRKNVFKNNIIYVGKQGRVMSSRSGRMDDSPTVTFDHNIYFYPGGSKSAKWSYDHQEFGSFEEYVQASGNDKHSRFADPEFLDAAANNFHLRAESSARNGGENLGPQIVGDVDLEGRHRVDEAKIDIGGFQTQYQAR